MKCEKCHKPLQCECWEPSLKPRTEPARPAAEFASTDWVAELEAALANAERLWKRAEAEKNVPLVVNCARCAGTYEACLNEERRRSATDEAHRRAEIARQKQTDSYEN